MTAGASTTVAGLHAVRLGSGRPVVALHGGLGTHVTWLPFVEAAGAVEAEFWLVDSPGHGHSDPPVEPLSYPVVADAIARMITEAGLDRPVVLGWSDGGQAALELAVRHPGVAGALVVGGASASFDRSGLREKHRQLLGADEQHRPNLPWLDLLLGDEGPTIKDWQPGGEEQWRTVVEASAGMWLTYEGLTDAQVAGIDVPVLVLGADRDELVPPAQAALLFDTLTDAELAIVPAADHDAIRTRAGAPAFVGPVAGFLARHPASG